MPSPFSQDIENMMATITKSLDATTKSAPVTSAGQSASTAPSTISTKIEAYGKHIAVAYVALSILIAIVWTRYRSRSDEDDKTSKEKKQKPVSIAKVLVWTIVFNMPLVVWLYAKRK